MLLIEENYTATLRQLKENGLSVIPCILNDEDVIIDFNLYQKEGYAKLIKNIEPISCKVYKGMVIKHIGKHSQNHICDYKLVVEDTYIIRLEESRVLDKVMKVYKLDLTY